MPAYTKAIKNLADKKIDLDTDTVKAILLDDSYTPDQDADEFIADLVGELSGGAYARVTVTGKLLTTSAGTVKFTSDDISFPGLTTTTARYLVVAHSSGSDSTSYLLFYQDFTSDQVATSQALNVLAPTDGWLEWAV